MNNFPGIGWFTLDLYTPTDNQTNIQVYIKTECQSYVEIQEKVSNLEINNMSVGSAIIKSRIDIIENILTQSMLNLFIHSHSFYFLELDCLFIVFCSVDDISNLKSVIDSGKQIKVICFNENIYHVEIDNSILLFLKIDANNNTDSKE